MTTPDPSVSTPGPDLKKVPAPPAEDTLREHSYDGIREYDKRLPRWWLLTLYGAIFYSIAYWAYYHAYDLGASPEIALQSEMAENASRLARQSGILDDSAIWRMSTESTVLAGGKATFDSTCAACHKPDLTGLIGPNLVDNQWIHGGKPMDTIKTITDGVVTKGMPPWGAILGQQKIAEVTAYIFSFHKAGESVISVPGWTPPGAGVPAPAASQ